VWCDEFFGKSGQVIIDNIFSNPKKFCDFIYIEQIMNNWYILVGVIGICLILFCVYRYISTTEQFVTSPKAILTVSYGMLSNGVNTQQAFFDMLTKRLEEYVKGGNLQIITQPGGGNGVVTQVNLQRYGTTKIYDAPKMGMDVPTIVQWVIPQL
jgi:hypothetical protein